MANLVWPDVPVERGRWRWVMQPVITSTGGATPPAMYTFEKNPHTMESPFPEISSQDSARMPYVDSSGLADTIVLRTKFDLTQFRVEGRIWSLLQYTRMQEFYDWPGLVAIRDHFGRVFVVRLMNFDVQPKIPSATRPHKYEYSLECQLWQFSESSGAVVDNAVAIGKVFNAFGPGTTPVDAWDLAIGADTNTVMRRQYLPSDWQAMSAASDWRQQWDSKVVTWPVLTSDTDMYNVIVLAPPDDFYLPLSQGKSSAVRTIQGIAESLRTNLPALLWGEVSIALGVSPESVLVGSGLPRSLYSPAFRVFASTLKGVSPRLIPVARYPWTQATSPTLGGMWADAPVACLYVRFSSSVSLAQVIDNLAVFRQAVNSRGGMFAVTFSMTGTSTLDGKSPDEVLTQMYAAARAIGAGQAQLSFYGYEDYVSPVPTTTEMMDAYRGLYLGAETVTPELLGRV